MFFNGCFKLAWKKQTNEQTKKKTNTEWENKFPSVLNEHLPLISKVTRGQWRVECLRV